MNRLTDLLIALNRERLPDDYIQREVELFIEDLREEFLGLSAIQEQEMEDTQTAPTFCVCATEEQRILCPHNQKCIRLAE